MKTCGLLFKNEEFQDGESKEGKCGNLLSTPVKLDFLGLLLPQRLPLVSGEAGLTSIEHSACYADESVKDCRQQQIYMMISWVTFSVIGS